MDEHRPVLFERVVQAFAGLPESTLVVDATFGRGGHARGILAANTGVRLLGIDRDPDALDSADAALEGLLERAHVTRGRFSEWATLAREHSDVAPSGLLMDVGVSSPQLDHPDRGFSFRFDGPLDMRMDPEHGPTAREWLTDQTQSEIARVLREYADERFSGRIARRIKEEVNAGRLHTTLELAELCEGIVPAKGRGKIHPATRTFQALRIAVNDELNELRRALDSVPEVFSATGVVVVISFHSLEDRIVKETFRDWQRNGHGRIVKPAPYMADEKECLDNPRARSAKLREFRWGEDSKPKGADRYRSKRHRTNER